MRILTGVLIKNSWHHCRLVNKFLVEFRRSLTPIKNNSLKHNPKIQWLGTLERFSVRYAHDENIAFSSVSYHIWKHLQQSAWSGVFTIYTYPHLASTYQDNDIFLLLQQLFTTTTNIFVSRADSRLALSQWETPLQSNAVSHWLGATLESVLICLTNGPHNCLYSKRSEYQFGIFQPSTITHWPIGAIWRHISGSTLV